MLDEIIEALNDGKWHSLNEISTRKEPLSRRSMVTLSLLLNFLSKYDFVRLRKELNGDVPQMLIVEAKLSDSVLRFLRRVKWIERSEVKCTLREDRSL